jgi:hypothetical protein
MNATACNRIVVLIQKELSQFLAFKNLFLNLITYYLLTNASIYQPKCRNISYLTLKKEKSLCHCQVVPM